MVRDKVQIKRVCGTNEKDDNKETKLSRHAEDT
jgi:hypothetical protein